MKCWHPEEKTCQYRDNNFHCRLIRRKKITPCLADVGQEVKNRLTLSEASGNVDKLHIYSDSVQYAQDYMMKMKMISRIKNEC